MQPATYQTVIEKYFQRPICPPRADPVPTNVTAAEFPRYINHHVAQVGQLHQIVNAEDILKQQLLESLEKN